MPPISTFIGRDDERAKLVELVTTRQMVTVVGPGGIGKTRLATEVCAEVPGRFGGGVKRCELAALAPRDDIVLEVAGMLGFRSLDALAVAIGEGSTLLLLDNCEHVLGAAAQLCARLLESVPDLHVIATSREPLGIDGEHLLVLGPLELPATADRDAFAGAAATRLFEDRARASGGSWDLAPEQLEAIVEGLGIFAGPFDARLAQAAAAGESGHLEGRFVDAMVAEADRLVFTGLARWGADTLGDVLTQFGNLVAALELCLVRNADATRAFRLLLPTSCAPSAPRPSSTRSCSSSARPSGSAAGRGAPALRASAPARPSPGACAPQSSGSPSCTPSSVATC